MAAFEGTSLGPTQGGCLSVAVLSFSHCRPLCHQEAMGGEGLDGCGSEGHTAGWPTKLSCSFLLGTWSQGSEGLSQGDSSLFTIYRGQKRWRKETICSKCAQDSHIWLTWMFLEEQIWLVLSNPGISVPTHHGLLHSQRLTITWHKAPSLPPFLPFFLPSSSTFCHLKIYLRENWPSPHTRNLSRNKRTPLMAAKPWRVAACTLLISSHTPTKSRYASNQT